jgi:ABC-type methionine transport system ATPase subunit
MIVEQKVRFIYPQHLLNRPLISMLARQFNLLTNILEAQVSSTQGWLVLLVRGEPVDIREGLNWIAEQGVQIEVIEEVAEES